MAISYASFWNSVFLETKSVSHASTTAPTTAPPACVYAAATPAPSVRSAFLEAIADLCLRRIIFAFSISPPASSSAFLHCMIDTPVSSRNCFNASEIAIHHSVNHKIQIPKFKQYLSSKLQTQGLDFINWNLFGIWCLELETFCLPTLPLR